MPSLRKFVGNKDSRKSYSLVMGRPSRQIRGHQTKSHKGSKKRFDRFPRKSNPKIAISHLSAAKFSIEEVLGEDILMI